ncbi:MAG: hypothetical protein E6I58_04675 [Chloroflexi bacterium]|nr:MAG: hypothetical protein E6I58_04675 [Chloroflexota bacterium]
MHKAVKQPSLGIDGGAGLVEVGVAQRAVSRIRHAAGQVEDVIVGVDVQAAEGALVEVDLQQARRRAAFEPVRRLTGAIDDRRAVDV